MLKLRGFISDTVGRGEEAFEDSQDNGVSRLSAVRQRIMSRIDRIRADIIGRVSQSSLGLDRDDDGELSAESMLESGRLGRHLWRQTDGRRRQIVKRLFDLTVEDFDKRL